MRKSPLSIAIGMSIMPTVQLASTRVGPISPYQTALNQEIYYRMLGQQIWRGRSPGKTRSLEKSVLWPYRYQFTKEELHDQRYQEILKEIYGKQRVSDHH